MTEKQCATKLTIAQSRNQRRRQTTARQKPQPPNHSLPLPSLQTLQKLLIISLVCTARPLALRKNSILLNNPSVLRQPKLLAKPYSPVSQRLHRLLFLVQARQEAITGKVLCDPGL